MVFARCSLKIEFWWWWWCRVVWSNYQDLSLLIEDYMFCLSGTFSIYSFFLKTTVIRSLNQKQETPSLLLWRLKPHHNIYDRQFSEQNLLITIMNITVEFVVNLMWDLNHFDLDHLVLSLMCLYWMRSHLTTWPPYQAIKTW